MIKKLRLFSTLLLLAVVSVGWAEDIVITQSALGLTGSYTSNTEKTIDGITFVYTDLMKNNENIQAKANTGVIYNKTAFPGDIVNVAITHSGTARATTILGSSNGTDWTQVATGSGSITGDFSGQGYKYFKITRGSNAAYWTKIEVTYTNASSGPVDPTVTFTSNPFEIEVGATGTNTITKPSDLTVTYSTDDETVATVNASTGEVRGVAVGETTIIASWAAVENKYKAGSASYTVNVIPEKQAVVFEKVTSASQLVAGNEYILVSADNNTAMGSQNGSYRNKIDVTVSDNNSVSVTNEAVTVLTLGGSYGAWTLRTSDDNKYLCYPGNKNTLNVAESDTAVWVITDDFQVRHGNVTSRYIKYNSNSGQERFSTYVSGQQKAVLFMKQGGTISNKEEAGLVFTPNEIEVEAGQTATVTFAKATNATVSFSNSNSEVATYDAENGIVTALKAGTTTIIATSPENEGYLAGEATLTVTVTAPAVSEVKVTDDSPYEESFATNFGSFTTDNTTIWTHATYNNDAYAKATSYIGGSNTDGDAWLTSPIIDLTEVAQAELEFNQAINKYFGTVADEAMLCIKEVDGEWVKQDISYPELGNKTFSSFESQTLDISAFAGKKIVVGFHYIGSSSNAGTWEVNNFKVSGSSTIQLKDAELAFTPATIEVEENATATVEFTKSTTADVTFTNEDPTVATYDATTGVVSALKVGTTTITANSQANDEYDAGTAALTITVTEKTEFVDVVKGCGIYQKITSANDLEAGKRYLIVYETQDNDLNDVADVFNGVSNKIGQYVEMPRNNEKVDNTIGTATHPIVLQSAGSTNWYLMDGDNFLYWTSGNYLYTSDKVSQEGNTWSINFGESGMSINNVSTPERYLQFNASSPRFACYTGTQKNVVLYKELTEAPQLEIITVSDLATDGNKYYSTLYYGQKNLKIPAGITASGVSVNGKSLVMGPVLAKDDVIAKGNAVLLTADAYGDYEFTVVADTEVDANISWDANLLRGNDEEATTKGGDVYYQLSLNATHDANSIGFYWGAADGGAFNNKAHRAYLVVPAEQAKGITGFTFGDMTDGIRQIENGQLTIENAEIYNLSGQRVNKAQKGIYIVNGKKVVMK